MSPKIQSPYENGADASIANNLDPTSWIKWIENNISNENISSNDLLAQIIKNQQSKRPLHEPSAHDYLALHATLIDSLLDDARGKNERDGMLISDSELQQHSLKRKWSKMRSFGGSSSLNPALLSDDDQDASSEILPCLSSVSSMSQSTVSSMNSLLTLSSPPASLLSPNCRLQKDRGTGLEPGMAVQVVGRQATLDKLRIKTEILKKLAGGSSGSPDDDASAHTSSSFDRKSRWLSSVSVHGGVVKKGVVHMTCSDPIETRSILSFKMGFYSMKYGIILQWGREDGLVHLVVMRKNVVDGFLRRRAPRVPPVGVGLSRMTSSNGLNGHIASTTGRKGHMTSSTTNRGKAQELIIPHDGNSSDDSARDDKSSRSDITKLRLDTIDTTGLQQSTIPPNNELDSSLDQGLTNESPRSVCNFKISKVADDSNAIIECQYGESSTEVTLIQAPYLVPRPVRFPRTSITVSILRVINVRAELSSKPKNLFATLSIQNQRHETGPLNTHRRVNDSHRCGPCMWHIDEKDGDSLRIQVHHRNGVREGNSDDDQIIACAEYALEDIEAYRGTSFRIGGCHNKPRDGHPIPTEITVPCQMMHDPLSRPGCITLSVVYISPYRWWLNQELTARRQLSEKTVTATTNDRSSAIDDFYNSVAPQEEDFNGDDEVDKFYETVSQRRGTTDGGVANDVRSEFSNVEMSCRSERSLRKNGHPNRTVNESLSSQDYQTTFFCC